MVYMTSCPDVYVRLISIISNVPVRKSFFPMQ
jgi:hypothetical protein